MIRVLAAVLLVVVVCSPALAGVIGGFPSTSPSPLSYSVAPGANASGSVDTSVSVSGTVPGSGVVDILFLTDTTGSMGGYITTTKSVFGSVLNSLRTGQPSVNFQWSIADYKDHLDGTPYSTQGIRIRQTFTSSDAAATAAFNTLSASGGGDTPEQQLESLSAAAQNWTGALLSGRTDSQKIVVWAGDAPGHTGYSAYNNHTYPTVAQTIDDLTDELITVIGLNSTSSGNGIDQGSQAQQITDQTDGALFNNVSGATANQISQYILNSISAVLDTVNTIAVTVDGDLGGWVVNVLGSPVTGTFDENSSPVLSTFGLDIIAPLLPDTRTVFLSLRADGDILAQIPLELSTVQAAVPEPASIGIWMLLGLAGAIGWRHRVNKRS